MNKTEVVNIRVTGTASAVYGGRPHGGDPRTVPPGGHGFLGNPFVVGADGSRHEVIDKFRVYFYQRLEDDPSFLAAVTALRGRKLGCFCKPMDCHLDVVAEWLDKLT